jgi:hypothetical protein
MRILLATHHLQHFAGTETYSVEVTKHLIQRGHEVTVYAPFLGESADELIAEDVNVTSEISALRKQIFDVAHVHHNVIAVQVRSALPDVPIVWMRHGIFPWLEQPPPFKPEVILAVSEEIASELSVAWGFEVTVVPNPIDVDHFKPQEPVADRPRRAVAVTNHLTPQNRKVIWEACDFLGIEIRHIGLPEAPVRDVRPVYEKADLVFGVGRTALEAAAMERNVLVFDQYGFDGWLDATTYDRLSPYGFSGRAQAGSPTADEIAALIHNEYDPSRGPEVRKLIIEKHSFDRLMPILEDQYCKAQNHSGANGDLSVPRFGCEMAELFSAYQRDIRGAQARIEAMESELGRRITELESQLAERDGVHAARASELRNIAERALAAERAALARVEAIEHSTAWKVTKLLRRLADVIKGRGALRQEPG